MRLARRSASCSVTARCAAGGLQHPDAVRTCLELVVPKPIGAAFAANATKGPRTQPRVQRGVAPCARCSKTWVGARLQPAVVHGATRGALLCSRGDLASRSPRRPCPSLHVFVRVHAAQLAKEPLSARSRTVRTAFAKVMQQQLQRCLGRGLVIAHGSRRTRRQACGHFCWGWRRPAARCSTNRRCCARSALDRVAASTAPFSHVRLDNTEIRQRHPRTCFHRHVFEGRSSNARSRFPGLLSAAISAQGRTASKNTRCIRMSA